MEQDIMKIKRLVIKNLYDHVGYDINFNDSITFLYGDNGCGKTTILNIVTYIITGKVYKLLDYKFKEINLFFQHEESKNQQKITVTYKDEQSLIIEFMSEIATIDRHLEFDGRSIDEREDIHRMYFSSYPILEKIKNTFNYIYLPLNRNGSLSLNLDSPYVYRSRRLAQMKWTHQKNRFGSSNPDLTLYEVEALVMAAFSKCTATLNRINEDFSDDILKSFLDVEEMLTIEKISGYKLSLTPSKIKKTQSEYINVLKTLKKWDSSSSQKVNAFFESLLSDIGDGKESVAIDFLFKISEFFKITGIIDKAEKKEAEKQEARRPIETFLSTVNNFISNNINQKEICIDEEGIIYLRTSNNQKISIQNMSSGEKQIVTFFAYLVFGLETTNQSIFIVDEPELSLHLNWQRQFVDSIFAVNKNIQLIFATHAPEIIGRHREKALKLIPEL